MASGTSKWSRSRPKRRLASPASRTPRTLETSATRCRRFMGKAGCSPSLAAGGGGQPVELGAQLGHGPLELGDVGRDLLVVIIVVIVPQALDAVVDEVLGLVQDLLPPVEHAGSLALLGHPAHPQGIQRLLKERRCSTYV